MLKHYYGHVTPEAQALDLSSPGLVTGVLWRYHPRKLSVLIPWMTKLSVLSLARRVR